MRFTARLLAISLALASLAFPAFGQTPAPPVTGATLLQNVQNDAPVIASDNAAIVAAQAKLQTDTAQAATDTATFVAFLSMNGPSYSLNADGSVTIFTTSATSPSGYTTSTAQPLSAPVTPASSTPTAPTSGSSTNSPPSTGNASSSSPSAPQSTAPVPPVIPPTAPATSTAPAGAVQIRLVFPAVSVAKK
jgi:hypothetical protein